MSLVWQLRNAAQLIDPSDVGAILKPFEAGVSVSIASRSIEPFSRRLAVVAATLVTRGTSGVQGPGGLQT